MPRRTARFAGPLLILAGLLACQQKAQTPPAPLTVTVAPGTAAADGTASVAVTVTGSLRGPIILTTTRGTFPNGQKTVSNASTSVTNLVLTSCDSRVDARCAGVTLVSASDANQASGSTQVIFTAMGGGTVTCTDCSNPACAGKVCDTNGHTCSTTSPSSCTVCPGGGVEICNDGIDNDCNGYVDCADPACQPVGNALGQICDNKGNTCSPPGVLGGSQCNVCSGNGGAPELKETSCGDGHDNDCNGLVDCQDPNCYNNGLSCSPTGKTCSAGTQRCDVCPGGQTAETTCNDGQDNDCDGLVDCKDPDCQPTASAPGKACGANGMTCSAASGGSCVCSGNGGVAQATETSCGDGFDNDCDGLKDCADPDCNGKSCDANGSVGKTCSSGQCVCSGGSVEICNDGVDNNCDGKIDCADPSCQPSSGLGQVCDNKGNTCSAGGLCNVCGGNGGTAEPTKEVSCGDHYDNDCDGLIDCDDPDCRNQACDPNRPSYQCLPVTSGSTTYACTDSSTLCSVALTAARPAPYAALSGTSLPADGLAQTVITATVKCSGAVVPNASVTFASSDANTTVTSPATTNGSGQATSTFTSSDQGGTATVTATYTKGSTPVVGTIAVDMPLLNQIKLFSQQYSILGVRYSGFQEKSTLTFQALDSAGNTYPAGLAIAFTHDSQGDSFIGAVKSCTVANPSVCSASGVTDKDGKVQVLLTSGKVAGVVSVKADATAGGIAATATAGNIAIVGAKASGAHISIDCNPRNVPALTDDNGINSNYKGPGNIITCTASFADRFNNVLGIATLATFKTEAGAAGPPSTTPQYDPAKLPNQQTGLGIATNFINVTGFSLPADVPPFVGEYSYTSDFGDGLGPKERNPRDGLSTVIVTANGEEGFVDLNANGVYDLGEPFIDMGEPYVDVNDNGQFDWVDLNGNGKMDPGEGLEPFVDLNGNGVYDGPNGVWDANTVIWAETRVVYTGFPAVLVSGPSTTDYASRWFTWGTPLPDPSVRPSFDLFTSTPGPATTQTYDLFFTDRNFNLVSPTTSYAVAALVGNASVKYLTLPTTVDNYGLTFKQQYCDKPLAPTACASGSAESACKWSPCYVVTNVGGCDGTTCTGFSYGAFGSALVSCSKAGGDTLQSTGTLNNVATGIYMSGVCRDCAGSLTNCSNKCVDTTKDAANCGACGTVCATGASCSSSVCVCPAGQQVCGTACTNVNTDSKNCGTCGNACATGLSCITGVCQ